MCQQTSTVQVRTCKHAFHAKQCINYILEHSNLEASTQLLAGNKMNVHSTCLAVNGNLAVKALSLELKSWVVLSVNRNYQKKKIVAF